MKKSAYRKDILRTIRYGKKRFVSILIIVALGVIMTAGLRAACEDLKKSADAFYDEQSLYDIAIQSTLGLTDDDVDALLGVEGVDAAEGGYSETVYLSDETHESVLIKDFVSGGLNQPYLIDGVLPTGKNEIAVSEGYLENSGKQIGDTLTIEEIEEEEDSDDEDSDTALICTEFTITAVVQDPANINNPDSSTSFRDTSTTDYTFFVSESAVDSDIYTSVYLTASGAAQLECYSNEYESLISEVKGRIEATVKSTRQDERTQEIRDEAEEEINEAEDEMNEAFEEAEAEIADAKEQLDDAKEQLDDAKEQLDDAKEQLDEGWAEYYDGLAQIEEAERELESGIETLQAEEDAALAQIEEAKAELAENKAAAQETLAELDENEELVCESITQIEEALSQLSQIPEGYDEEIDAQRSALEETLSQLEASLEEIEAAIAQIQAALSQIEAGEEELAAQEEQAQIQFAAAWEEIEEASAELKEARAELAEGAAELKDGQTEYEEGLAEYEEGLAEYEEGLAEYEESVAEYEQEKADALSEISDAWDELDELEEALWYVSDRASLSGYANIESDAGAIEAIGNYFPIIFLAVAVLISLTTITRMVDEERGLIGTYKALGFSNAEIRRKYVIYSLSACLAGSIVGEAGGFIGLPAIVFVIFKVMYSLPAYAFSFDLLYGILGPAVFFAGVGFATWFACRRALSRRPAVLMRPKTPKAGSRVFLERIGFFWRRLSFLNKVTARNLFRYKKRLLMTVIGIAGCTGILLFGFSIKNSVSDLVTHQYEETYKYDLLAVATDNEEFLEYMDASDGVESYLGVRIDSVTVEYGGETMTVQIIVVPDEESAALDNYISLETISGEGISLESGDILMTRNISQMLGFSAGSEVTLQDLTLAQGTAAVTALVKNYLGNYIYMTASVYEEIFGSEYEANGALAMLSDSVDDTQWAEELSHEDSVSSAIATQQLEDEFDSAFILMDMVVYIIIVMAAALAFVVLFTLSTTNISEREREIATIKVLGFYDREVHTYVNKEMMLLTVMGIIPGLVAGYFLAHGMTYILKMPSLYFAVSIYPASYIIAIVLTLVFAVLVQFITNRVLNKVDPVEALKSVE